MSKKWGLIFQNDKNPTRLGLAIVQYNYYSIFLNLSYFQQAIIQHLLNVRHCAKYSR